MNGFDSGPVFFAETVYLTTHSPEISHPSRTAAPAADPDLALVRRFAEHGDAAAFGQIVQKYAGCVYATCLRVLGDSARAEEASQETFFRLMRRPGDVTQNLGGWLHRTATHLSLDAVRSDTARRRREISYSNDRDHEASTWAELSPCVDQALTEMPEELRMILVEHFLLGKTQAQLAEQTGQSPATISRRVRDGLDQLRARLRLKGIYALPAVLAGLFCHVAARQAPAGLMLELGKMAMLSGASRGAVHCNGAAKAEAARQHRRLITRAANANVIAPVAAIVGAVILFQCLIGLGVFRFPSPPRQHVAEPPPSHTISTSGHND